MGIETILLATTAIVGTASAIGRKNQAAKDAAEVKKATKAREQQLADEAAAKVAADKKAETTGQRIGFPAGGIGGAIASAFAPGTPRLNSTGFKAPPSEDNLGRGALFGN